MTGRALLLLRHAKSSWDDPSLDDYDRPLARRGWDAAPRIGAEMARRGWRPQMALVSGALRARQTWELVAPFLRPVEMLRFDAALHEAPAQRILEAVRDTPERIGSLLIVGHNPGLSDLALSLASPEPDADVVERMRTKFPTCAVARIAVPGAWSDLAAGTARLEAFFTPADLSTIAPDGLHMCSSRKQFGNMR